MKSKKSRKKLLNIIFFIAFILSCSNTLKAQGITTYQYRYVAPENVTEFIKRETTYWSNVAQKAIDKGTLTFWGLFEKVGGSDLQNSPNFLFINTFKDIDGNMNDMWNAAALYPKIPLNQIQTNTLSKVTSNIFLSDDGWQQRNNVVAAKDFKYVVMNYHNSSNPGNFIATENKHWQPFIQAAMNAKQTPQLF